MFWPGFRFSPVGFQYGIFARCVKGFSWKSPTTGAVTHFRHGANAAARDSECHAGELACAPKCDISNSTDRDLSFDGLCLFSSDHNFRLKMVIRVCPAVQHQYACRSSSRTNSMPAGVAAGSLLTAGGDAMVELPVLAGKFLEPARNVRFFIQVGPSSQA